MQHEDLERNFGFLLNDVARLMRTTFDRRVKAMGLTRSQWWVLTHLFRNDGTTQAALADILEVERPTLGRLLDRLEAKGLVNSRIGGGDDDRSGRARRHFRIVPDGVEALSRLRSMRDGLWSGVDLVDLAAEAEGGS